jgi:hypothetical protein
MEPEPDIRCKKGGPYGFNLDSDYFRGSLDFSPGLAAAEVRHLHLNEARLPVGR